MKHLILVCYILYYGIITAQTITISGNQVIIDDGAGNTWLVSDTSIIKNGTELLNSEKMYELDEADDLLDELDDLKDNLSDLTDEDYADLNRDLAELERALANIEYTKEYTGMHTDSLPDTASIQIGKWKIVVKEKGSGNDVDISLGKDGDNDDEYEIEDYDDHDIDNFETDWILLSLGYNDFLNAENKLIVDAPYEQLGNLRFWGSTDVNLDLFRSQIRFANDHLNIGYGIGLEWHHFRFNDDFSILADTNILVLNSETINYDKNKFNTTHLTLPLTFGFETKPWDTEESFRMYFGYDPGLRIRAKTKHKVSHNTDKEIDDFNLESFRQEVNVMIGYGKFNLYASYDLTPMFKEAAGPELHPVSVGIVIRRGFDH